MSDRELRQAERLRFTPLHRIGLVAALAIVALRSFAAPVDPDLFWHLAAGREIASTSSVPEADPFSFTARAGAWHNHEWLSQLLLFRLHVAGGLPLIRLVTSLFLTAAFVVMLLRMRRAGAHPTAAIALLLMGALASSGGWGTRIQVVALFFFATELWLIDRRQKRSMYLIPLLVLVWTNVHGSFPLAIAALAIAVLTASDRSARRRLALTLAASVFATAVNPAGIGAWRYPLEFLRGSAFSGVIAELQPPDFRLPQMMAFALLLILAAAGLALSQRRTFDLLLVVALTPLALSQVRHVALWVAAALPLAALGAAQPWRRLAGRFPSLRRANAPPPRGARRLLDAVLAVGLGFAIVATLTDEVREAVASDREGDHEASGAFARLQTRNARLFTEYDWGGHAIWSLHPRAAVFIDGRADTVYADRVLRDYFAIHEASPRAGFLLDRYGVTDVVVRRGAPIAELLSRSPAWRRAHRDREAVHFERTAAASRRLRP